jgi:hypothetical protein
MSDITVKALIVGLLSLGVILIATLSQGAAVLIVAATAFIVAALLLARLKAHTEEQKRLAEGNKPENEQNYQNLCKAYEEQIRLAKYAQEEAENAKEMLDMARRKYVRRDRDSDEKLCALKHAAKTWRLWAEDEIESRELSDDERHLFDAVGWFVDEGR